MIVLGVVLVLLVLLVTIFAVVASGTISTGIALTGLGVSVSATPLTLFLAGALSVILLGLGFALISRGTRRKAGKRKELKTLRKEHAAPATRTTDDREGGHPDHRGREPGPTTNDRGGVQAQGGRTEVSTADDSTGPDSRAADTTAPDSRTGRSDAPSPRRLE